MIITRKRKMLNIFVTLLAFTMLITACASIEDGDENGPDVLISEAQIESMDILILESFPVQVKAHVRWSLPDDCTVMLETTNERIEDLFQMKILTKRPADKECAQKFSTFEETFTLDVLGLDRGTYVVDVNGRIGEFTLEIKNELPE